MNALLKNMLAKNAAFDRRLRESVRTSRFGSRGLLVWSMLVFALAGLFWIGISRAEFQIFRPTLLFLAVTFLAPSLVVVAVMDMVRSRWAWSRFIALIISLCAVLLLVAGIYRLMHGYNAV
ncbi:MAG TPA: hypothetical protein VK815_02905 [Candidatus Acidoferrales bacterium]|nr:hypothetical protein [Candidatus Acidoferrales bacterium]